MTFKQALKAARKAGCRFRPREDGLYQCRTHVRGLKCPHCRTWWMCGEVWPYYLKYPGARCLDRSDCAGTLVAILPDDPLYVA